MKYLGFDFGMTLEWVKAYEMHNYPGKLSGNSLISGTCPVAEGIPKFTSGRVSRLSMCMTLYKLGRYAQKQRRSEREREGEEERGGVEGERGGESGKQRKEELWREWEIGRQKRNGGWGATPTVILYIFVADALLSRIYRDMNSGPIPRLNFGGSSMRTRVCASMRSVWPLDVTRHDHRAPIIITVVAIKESSRLFSAMTSWKL